MKVMDRVDVVIKLKERIDEAKTSDIQLAKQLQALLDSIMDGPKNLKSI